MTARILALILGCCAGAAWADGPGKVPASSAAAPPSDVLAAEGLRHSATCLVHCPPGTPARAARLVAIGRFAHRLAPNDPFTNLLLANVIYRSQGRPELAAQAAEAYLAAFPEDHSQALVWLELALEARNKAEERVTFLRSVIRRGDLPAPLRAEAAADLGQVLLGQGQLEQASEAFAQARQLDAYNPKALNAWLALHDDPSGPERVQTMLGLIRGNPMAVALAWQLAVELDSLGLHAASLEFFRHAWQVTQRRAGLEDIPHDFAAHYMNAMLSAGEHRKVIQMAEPLLKRFAQSVDLLSLLAEAYRAAGDAQNEARLIQQIQSIYEGKDATAPDSPDSAVELAMFYLISRPDAEKALLYARRAAGPSPADPVVQRILGVAELASGQADAVRSGEERLTKLIDKDVYAAVFLAEHRYLRGDDAAGKAALLAGASVSRSGPAYRRLAAVAAKHRVVIAPSQQAERVLPLLAGFDRRCLQMGAEPEKFIAASIRPVRQVVRPGEPLEVEAVLANHGPVEVPMGRWGLLCPAMGLQVDIAGETEGRFTNLPVAVWPVRRYLRPGEQVACKVRLDVGRLAALLARHPLRELSLTVSGTLDPIQRGDRFRSGLPTVAVGSSVLRRVSLLGEIDPAAPDAWPEAYRRAMERIGEDIRGARLPARLIAARQVASLLARVHDAQAGGQALPKPLANEISQDPILSMLESLLKDSSEAVRAETVAALGHVRLDDKTLSLLGAAIDDRSALVRLRVVELLGTSRSPGHEAIVEYLAKDPDELVRLMASAFGKAK